MADVHLMLKLPASRSGLLNDGNLSDTHDDLVVEIICVGTVTQADAESACAGHVNQQATETGLRHALFLTRPHARFLRPGLAGLTGQPPPVPAPLRAVDRAYRDAIVSPARQDQPHKPPSPKVIGHTHQT